jgi:hypothetical protein
MNINYIIYSKLINHQHRVNLYDNYWDYCVKKGVQLISMKRGDSLSERCEY